VLKSLAHWHLERGDLEDCERLVSDCLQRYQTRSCDDEHQSAVASLAEINGISTVQNPLACLKISISFGCLSIALEDRSVRGFK
jgi:hypothetical protein